MAKKSEAKEVVYKPLEVKDIFENLHGDTTSTCCGVLEIGEFPTKGNLLNGFEVKSLQTKDYDPYQYSPSMRGMYINKVPVSKRQATYEEVLTVFKKAQKDHWPKEYGLGVAWLLPVQHKGAFGRLFKALGWDMTGSSYNPKTRHTLYMYTKTFRKTQPRKKKSSKSILVTKGN